MSERLPVAIRFCGVPFERPAVVHTLRHLAMRAGWVLCTHAPYRILYVTDLVALASEAVTARDIVVLSSPAVGRHLAESQQPIPVELGADGQLLPFPHPEVGSDTPPGWIAGDVIAGAYAVYNLWYERRSRPVEQAGWMRFADDWWPQVGLTNPQPLADQWLDCLSAAARRQGWPDAVQEGQRHVCGQAGTLVLTHDVDYLPTTRDRGLPRLSRALVRQLVTRRRWCDALRLLAHYVQVLPRELPYFAFADISSREGQYGVQSSFQVTVARHHRADPTYKVQTRRIADMLRQLHTADWEVGLHGSYTASRTPRRLAAERDVLEQLLQVPVLGHRQHYLHFHPAQLFTEVECAGFAYDSSVGYNDCSGPRAGTWFPYRPYNVESGYPHQLWEIPFVLMDTTLATTYRFSPQAAWEHMQALLSEHQGCVAVIWHQEQLSGLLDPGFDQLYYRLLAWAHDAGIRLLPGKALLPELDRAWAATVWEDGVAL